MVKIMELKKYKNNNKRNSCIILVIGFLLISISSYLFYKSYALYEETKNFDVINGTVEDPGDIYFAYYIDGIISRSMPVQNTGYTLDIEKSNCTNGVKITWDHSTWQGITDYTGYNASTNTRTKCTLYFNKTSKTVSTVLGNIEINSYIPDFTKTACDDKSCESHEKGIYETTDYDGNPTYYYRGSVENNYVKFAGYYWRIIRINSNGSTRMIYDGTSVHANDESSEDRYYSLSKFNDSYTDNMYVGYMYSSGEIHGIKTSSDIKKNVDKFYQDKLNEFSSKLDIDVGFCGDRSVLNLQTNVGIGNEVTYYKSYLRVVQSTPTFICEDDNDYYTLATASKGNKALMYPIGLITVDEAMFAGHAGGIFNGSYNYTKTSINNYLTIGNHFWTMTPVGNYYTFGYSNLISRIFHIYSSGEIDDSGSYGSFGMRPVINIRSDVAITGSGTMNDPYVVN